MKGKLLGLVAVGGIAAFLLYACVDSGTGSDFDDDGIEDKIEDVNKNFAFDPGESDFISPDTDLDGLCDGQPDKPLSSCTGCEDCNNNGSFEPCLGETDPLNDDTDNDGIPDASDPAPLDGFAVDCSQGNVMLAFGASLPGGKPFPVRPTPTPSPAPFPTSTPGPAPTVSVAFASPTPG
jgi:hypothetical protein